MRAHLRLLLLSALVLGLVACTQSHYLVRHDQLPLYASQEGDEVLAHLPRFHHEPLVEEEDAGARIPITFQGQRGYAPRTGLTLFDYLEPALDGGRDRRRELRAQLRSAQVEVYGTKWPAEIAEAVREGRVIEGMSAHQVEVSWGWPLQVESGPTGQRWVYERTGSEIIQTYNPAFDSLNPFPLGAPCWGPGPRAVVRVERYKERRVLHLNQAGHVVGIEVTRTRL